MHTLSRRKRCDREELAGGVVWVSLAALKSYSKSSEKREPSGASSASMGGKYILPYHSRTKGKSSRSEGSETACGAGRNLIERCGFSHSRQPSPTKKMSDESECAVGTLQASGLKLKFLRQGLVHMIRVVSGQLSWSGDCGRHCAGARCRREIMGALCSRPHCNCSWRKWHSG